MTWLHIILEIMIAVFTREPVYKLQHVFLLVINPDSRFGSDTNQKFPDDLMFLTGALFVNPFNFMALLTEEIANCHFHAYRLLFDPMMTLVRIFSHLLAPV